MKKENYLIQRIKPEVLNALEQNQAAYAKSLAEILKELSDAEFTSQLAYGTVLSIMFAQNIVKFDCIQVNNCFTEYIY